MVCSSEDVKWPSLAPIKMWPHVPSYVALIVLHFVPTLLKRLLVDQQPMEAEFLCVAHSQAVAVRSVQWLFKNTPKWQKVVTVRKLEVGRNFKFDRINLFLNRSCNCFVKYCLSTPKFFPLGILNSRVTFFNGYLF